MSGRILVGGKVIEVRQGDSFSIIIQLHRRHNAIDFSNMQISMQVKDDNNKIVINKLATVIDSSDGKFALLLTPQDTEIPVGEYKTDIQLTLPDGSVHTFFPADINTTAIFRITEQVTR